MTYRQKIVIKEASATNRVFLKTPMGDSPNEIALQKQIKKLPPDFGPGHKLWKVPSFRNVYLRAKGVI